MNSMERERAITLAKFLAAMDTEYLTAHGIGAFMTPAEVQNIARLVLELGEPARKPQP